MHGRGDLAALDDVCRPSNLIYLPPGSPRARKAPRPPVPQPTVPTLPFRLINVVHWGQSRRPEPRSPKSRSYVTGHQGDTHHKGDYRWSTAQHRAVSLMDTGRVAPLSGTAVRPRLRPTSETSAFWLVCAGPVLTSFEPRIW